MRPLILLETLDFDIGRYPALGTSILSSYFHNSHEAGGVFVSILKTETGAQRGEMSRSACTVCLPLP